MKKKNGYLHLMCDFSMACDVAMEELGGYLSPKVLPGSERERELEAGCDGYHIVNIPCIGRLAGTELCDGDGQTQTAVPQTTRGLWGVCVHPFPKRRQ